VVVHNIKIVGRENDYEERRGKKWNRRGRGIRKRE
jgi:hypothetical protein